MSVLLSYVRDNVVYFGANVMRISSGRKMDDSFEPVLPILKTEEGVLVARPDGNESRGQELLSHPELFPLDKNGKLTFKQIITHILPAVYRFYKERNWLGREETCNMEAPLLIAHDGDLFEICSGFGVVRYRSYRSVGNISSMCTPCLAAIRPEKDVEEQFGTIFKKCSAYYEDIGDRFVTVNTKDLTLTVREVK